MPLLFPLQLQKQNVLGEEQKMVLSKWPALQTNGKWPVGSHLVPR